MSSSDYIFNVPLSATRSSGGQSTSLVCFVAPHVVVLTFDEVGWKSCSFPAKIWAPFSKSSMDSSAFFAGLQLVLAYLMGVLSSGSAYAVQVLGFFCSGSIVFLYYLVYVNKLGPRSQRNHTDLDPAATITSWHGSHQSMPRGIGQPRFSQAQASHPRRTSRSSVSR